MDPLSDVLSLLKIRSYASRAFQAGNGWSVRFGPSRGVKLFAVTSGEGWLALEEAERPVCVRAGDCVLLTSGRSYRVASDLSLTPVDGTQLLSTLGSTEIAQFNNGMDCSGVAGHFDMAGETAEFLLSILPPIVHVRKESDKQVLRWCLKQMMKEFQVSRPGEFLAAQQLATLMFIQILRNHLSSDFKDNVGWLYALADKHIGLSLQALHEKPGCRWTLTTLAQKAGMSRTGFALRFKKLVGITPMNYLTRWRMSLAKERILHSTDSINAIAMQIGYESESAFSTAFKRLAGCAPRRYAASLGVRSEADPATYPFRKMPY